jgi:iron complex outermembrane receptor protein
VRRPHLLIVLALLLAPGLAFADARAQAKKYFKQGMGLIGDGHYEEGIDRLLQAYDIKPHPNVLYNVAKAYEALGRPSLAIAFYRRYAETEPGDLTLVNASMAKLEAALPKAKPIEPPRTVEPTKPVEPGRAPVDEAALARLQALTERMEAALTKAEAAQKVGAEKPAAGITDGITRDDDDDALTEVPYEETVVTASRRAQSTLEAPNATTLITAEEIRLSGARSLPELLRRVPGAEVMAMGVASYNLSFRGFNQRVANKVLVLIDGRTEYQDFLGLTLWSSLPVGLEEIERIEVIRGPGSALYGANAMLGVINIITRAPGKGSTAEMAGVIGNGNRAGGSFVSSGGTTFKYRASAGYEQSDKWSRDYGGGRPDVKSNLDHDTLGLSSARANLVTTVSPSKEVTVSVSAGVNRFFTEIYAIGLLRNYFLDGVGGYALADAKLGPLKLKLFWNHLAGSTGPQYSAIGQRSLLTELESNVFDGEALFAREFTLLGTHRLGAGASTRLKRLSWGYITGLKQELHAAIFLQDEWRIVKPLLLTASYRLDYRPAVQGSNPSFAHSPRVSLLWRINESHAVRASFSTAFREPTFLESYTDVRAPVPGINGASVLTQGSTSLNPERLLSFELGYRGELGDKGLSWEVALYQNNVSDLVVLSAVNPVPADQAFDERSQSYLLGRSTFTNDPASYTARGGEAGITWAATDGLDIRLSLALQQVTSNTASACGPCSQAPAFKLFAGVSYRTPVEIDLGIDAAYTTSTTWVEREPDPQDPTRIANLQNPLPAYAVVNARIGYRLLKDRVSFAVVGTQLAAPHAEHPFGNLVNRRVFATVTVKP